MRNPCPAAVSGLPPDLAVDHFLSDPRLGSRFSCLETRSMPISVVCPGCKARFNVSDKFAGKKGPCPKCKTVLTVPRRRLKR